MATIAPDWMAMLNRSLRGPSQCWAISRWPVLEIGRNSVRPSRMPRRRSARRGFTWEAGAGGAERIEGLRVGGAGSYPEIPGSRHAFHVVPGDGGRSTPLPASVPAVHQEGACLMQPRTNMVHHGGFASGNTSNINGLWRGQAWHAPRTYRGSPTHLRSLPPC